MLEARIKRIENRDKRQESRPKNKLEVKSWIKENRK